MVELGTSLENTLLCLTVFIELAVLTTVVAALELGVNCSSYDFFYEKAYLVVSCVLFFLFRGAFGGKAFCVCFE